MQPVDCAGRKLEHAVNVCQTLCIRELCLKRRPSTLEQKTSAEVAVQSSGEHFRCDVRKVTGVFCILDTKPWNWHKNRLVA